MNRLRSVLIVLALAVGGPILLLLGAAAYVQAQLPPSQGERVRAPHGVVGIQTGSAYAWVIPSASGVILVDAGLDPTAKALLREIGQRKIQGVLLTHGHADHAGGLAALGAVEVRADPAAIEMLRGERKPQGWLARALSTAVADGYGEASLVPLPPPAEGEPGTVLEIDGERFLAVRVPGHTVGSVAWLWEDVLFSGDAVLGGSPLTLPPPATSDDPALAERSLEALLPLDFDAIADGHVGLTTAARSALFRLANQPPSPPRASVRTDGGAGAPGDVLERTGILVQTPAPDVRGEQPELLLLGDGSLWRLGDRPNPERAALDGHTVAVQARRLPVRSGPGLPVEVLSLRADDAPAEAPRSWVGKVGRWIEVTGTVSGFRPLSADAVWGEGAITVTEGSQAETIPLSAPVAAPLLEGGEATLRVRVAAAPGTSAGVRLVAAPEPREPADTP